MNKVPPSRITCIKGTISGETEIDNRSDYPVAFARNFYFDRDGVDGSWCVVVQRPEVEYVESLDLCVFGSGHIYVANPVVIEFIEAFCLLVAAPDVYGEGHGLELSGGAK